MLKEAANLTRVWLGLIGIALFLYCLISGVRAEGILSALVPLITQNQQIQIPTVFPENDQKSVENKIPPSERKASIPGIYGVYIGQKTEEAVRLLGLPQRKDLSDRGYEWWIYNKNLEYYVQVGVQDGKVADLYSNAPTWEMDGIKTGTVPSALAKRYGAAKKVHFQYEGASFTLGNTHEDHPLTLLHDIPVIFYLDAHDGLKVTGIRMMTKELLVKSKSYDLEWSYTGKAPQLDFPRLTPEQIKKVQQGMERQSLDLVNVSRHRMGLPILKWNEQAATVAKSHSQDMLTHQFFDHVSASTGMDPFDRMEKEGIRFHTAGENIAMGYFDAIEAHHGWMNSLGHRKNILNKDFTTLGVGLAGTYFTQNFVTP